MSDEGSRGIQVDGLELGEHSVIGQGRESLGGRRRTQIPYRSVTSVRVEEQHSLGLAFAGLLVAIWGAGLLVTVDELEAAWGIGVSAVGVVILLFALVWTRQAIVVESVSDGITQRSTKEKGELEAFADEVLERVGGV